MVTETWTQCVRSIGLSAGRADSVSELLKERRIEEARQRLRAFRCELMDEMHACQRKLDRLDWLIRETEKEPNT